MMHSGDIYEHRARLERHKELRALMRALVRILPGSSGRQTRYRTGGAAVRGNDNRKPAASRKGRDSTRSTAGASAGRIFRTRGWAA